MHALIYTAINQHQRTLLLFLWYYIVAMYIADVKMHGFDFVRSFHHMYVELFLMRIYYYLISPLPKKSYVVCVVCGL